MSDFSSQLNSFVNLYERCPEGIAELFENARLGTEFNVENEARYKDLEPALRASREQSSQIVMNRILQILGQQSLPSMRSQKFSETGTNESWSSVSGDYEDEKTVEFKQALAAEWSLSKEELQSVLDKEGITDEELGQIREIGKWAEIHSRFKSKQLSKPNLHIFFAREFISWVDLAVAQVENLGDVKFRDAIPTHLRDFLGEAYRCYLYGLDAACASLCGAILQEAIHIKLPNRNFGGLGEAIMAAEQECLLSQQAINAANEVKRLRNNAAHGSIRFIQSQQHERKYVLSLTREVLDTLFPIGD